MTSPWTQPNPADDWSDFDDTGSQSQGQQQQPNPVRERMRQLEKENKELKQQHEQLMSQVRQTNIAQTLSSKGLSPKLANLIPKDVEPTVEALDKWLADYADVFAPATPAEGSSSSDEGEGEGEGSAGADQYGLQMGRIAEATTGTRTALNSKEEVARQLARKDLTHSELLEMINQAGGGFGSG